MTQPPHHEATGGYEKKDADLKLILICALILLVVVVISFVIVRGTLSSMTRQAGKPVAELSPLWEGQVLPPEPRLRVNGRQRLEELRASEQALLTAYEWVDEAEGIARIPVSRAKELIASGHAAALELPRSKVSQIDVAIPESELPEYEATLDHARLVSMSGKEVMALGSQTYNRICMDCHGDLEVEGSVPTSLRFGEGRFQRGSDPHTMYRTLTQGWRTMPAQPQLTPREKYAVIHYIREHFLKPHNPSQHFTVTPDYLATLPKGTDLGPEPKPVDAEPLWSAMDYGNVLMGTFEISSPEKRAIPRPKDSKPDYISPGANLAYKGIAFRLTPGVGGISRGSEWSLFEQDTLRVAGAWNGNGFIDWHGINFDGKHVVRPRTVGTPLFETADSPGWANPETGTFEDTRFQASDGLRYGPLPRKWMHYRGIYRHGPNNVVSYTVGSAEVLEFHEFRKKSGGFLRHLNIGRSPHPLSLRLANAGTKVSVSGGNEAVSITESDGFVLASIPPEATPLNLVFAIGPDASTTPPAARNLHNWTGGGPPRWPTALEASIIRGTQPGAFQWDTFQVPDRNHWKCRIRLGGVDFTPDGNAVVCTWDGDVWSVEGINDDSAEKTTWKRIAAGLFQPLGIRMIGNDIYVSCRDQIVRLRDLNGDGEMDFYENFNSDHQVTEHFHEFAMGLQTDPEGNFYYAKSARHARPGLVPHHGTLIKVKADGSESEILAKGFRAANGVCLNPDGTFFVTDQEGHWNPMNRINHVVPDGGFYGNMWGYGAPEDTADTAMRQPLCWVDKSFDRSTSELLWVNSSNWGALNGSLLHLSYGHGRVHIVPHESVNGRLQGGLCRLPIEDLPTGIMRGRFHPENGHLYVCGLSAWGSSRPEFGGIYRVRATQKPSHLPVKLHAHTDGLDIVFSAPLHPDSIHDPSKRFTIESWAYKRSAAYGSKRYDSTNHAVTDARLSDDGRTLTLQVSDMAPCWQMSVKYRISGLSNEMVEGEILNTIHALTARPAP